MSIRVRLIVRARHCRPTAKEAVTLLAEIEENFRQQGRLEAISTTSGPALLAGDG